MTHFSCCVDAAVSSEDLARLPESAHGVLWTEVNRAAHEAHSMNGRTEFCRTDPDSAIGFPKTTITINVCLRPMRVMLMPAHIWHPVGSA